MLMFFILSLCSHIQMETFLETLLFYCKNYKNARSLMSFFFFFQRTTTKAFTIHYCQTLFGPGHWEAVDIKSVASCFFQQFSFSKYMTFIVIYLEHVSKSRPRGQMRPAKSFWVDKKHLIESMQ